MPTLKGCKAHKEGTSERVYLNGPFEPVEFLHREPSAYIWESGVLVQRANGTVVYFVDEYEWMRQTDPEGYARMEELERRMDANESTDRRAACGS